MVRIQHPSDEGTGSTTSTAESTTSTTPATIAGSKRSRPLSSLDFKPKMENKGKLIVEHDDISPDKNKADHQQQQSSGGSFTSNLMGMNPTRARGSAGFIPPKPKLTSLTEVFNSGLTDEEMMEVIYNDPDLTAKFAESQRAYQKQKEASASQQQYPSGSSSPAPRGAGGGRRPGSTGGSSYKKSPPIKSSKDRVELLKEDGIPYMQWAVLLILLVFSLYQLYVWMQPPENIKNNRKKQYAAEDDDLVAKELEGAIAKGASVANKSASSKKAYRSSNKKKPSTAATTVVPSSQLKAAVVPVKAADTTSVDKVSFITENDIPLNDESGWLSVKKNAKVAPSTVMVESKKLENSKSSIATEAVVATTPEDAITVHTSNTKKKAKNGKSSTVATVAANISTEIIPVEEVVVSYKEETPPPVLEPTVAAKVDEPASVKVAPEPDILPGTSNGTDTKDDIDNVDQGEATATDGMVTKKKKIKKKKAKTDSDTTAAVPQSDTVDADAALAQQLQNEENELAAAMTSDPETELTATMNGFSAGAKKENGSVAIDTINNNNNNDDDDDWAPVTKKKKAAQSKPDDVAADNTPAVVPTKTENVSSSKKDDDDDDEEDDE